MEGLYLLILRILDMRLKISISFFELREVLHFVNEDFLVFLRQWAEAAS